jgi:hypothetical protein
MTSQVRDRYTEIKKKKFNWRKLPQGSRKCNLLARDITSCPFKVRVCIHDQTLVVAFHEPQKLIPVNVDAISMADNTPATAGASSSNPGDAAVSGNTLLLRFFQSEWFTPAVC